ncbi:MAG TPA: hypothetical protein VF575_00685 [Candidatus Saccharimonadales bacterium]|jgi:endonuclease/exonuclease/phosphatase family metal-dependent hydrolase
MALEIATLNAAGSLSNPANVRPFVDYVVSLDVHAAGFPEAYNVGAEEGVREAQNLFHERGFNTAITPNGDKDGRTDQRGLLVVTQIDGFYVNRFASRNGIVGMLTDEATNIRVAAAHAHLDDRSEYTRHNQAHSIIEWLDQPDDIPGYAAMDANAMYRDDPRARWYRALKHLGRILPVAEPRIGQNEKDPRVIASKAVRASGMAHGGTLKIFEHSGYRNPNTIPYETTARFLGGRATAQLDHILVSKDISCPRYEVTKVPGGKGIQTEHLLIRATLET